MSDGATTTPEQSVNRDLIGNQFPGIVVGPSRRKDIKGQENSTAKARSEISRVFNSSRIGLEALRSWAQGFSTFGPSEIRQLSSVVDSGLRKDLDDVEGNLYQISDNSDIAEHNKENFLNDEGRIASARGFMVHIVKDGIGYECFVLDPGGSRSFYDNKSPDEKVEFAQRHVDRMRSKFPHPKGFNPDFPYDFFAIVSDLEDHYTIEQVLPYQA